MEGEETVMVGPSCPGDGWVGTGDGSSEVGFSETRVKLGDLLQG